jgi:hypothetical protein
MQLIGQNKEQSALPYPLSSVTRSFSPSIRNGSFRPSNITLSMFNPALSSVNSRTSPVSGDIRNVAVPITFFAARSNDRSNFKCCRSKSWLRA